jgi:nitrous oxidase accessory protein NosD
VGPYDGGEHAPIISVGRPVSRVRVEGFDIAGFSGPYVAVVGGRNVRIAGTSLRDSAIYGVLSTASRSTRITDNEISGPSVRGFIGICIDDLSSPVVDDNDISGQIIGVCVETTGASVSRNGIHDNCLGVFVDPGVGATITRNHITSNNGCDQLPASYGRGVTLSGTNGTVVSHNVFEGHTGPGGLAAVSVTDDEGGTVATGNVVTHNQFAANTLDISSTATGANRIDHNDCTASTPAQLCD